jgi:hypothetical protein
MPMDAYLKILGNNGAPTYQVCHHDPESTGQVATRFETFWDAVKE